MRPVRFAREPISSALYLSPSSSRDFDQYGYARIPLVGITHKSSRSRLMGESGQFGGTGGILERIGPRNLSSRRASNNALAPLVKGYVSPAMRMRKCLDDFECTHTRTGQVNTNDLGPTKPGGGRGSISDHHSMDWR